MGKQRRRACRRAAQQKKAAAAAAAAKAAEVVSVVETPKVEEPVVVETPKPKRAYRKKAIKTVAKEDKIAKPKASKGRFRKKKEE